MKTVRVSAIFACLAATMMLVTACAGTASKTPASSPLANQTTQPPAAATAPTGGTMKWNTPPAMTIDTAKDYKATIKTNKGDIVIQLFAKDSPKTANNFIFLARQGFYDGVKFHRVIKGFMIQTGDPQGTGAGGPGYKFVDELPTKFSYDPGIVAMANAGPNTNGSQFFICSGPQAKNLDSYPNYTQFGRVISGMDVVGKIENVQVGKRYAGDPETSTPTEDVHMISVTIEESAK